MGIYSAVMFLILLGRAAFVFPLSVFSNYMNRHAERAPLLTFKHQVGISSLAIVTIFCVCQEVKNIFARGKLQLSSATSSRL